MKTRLLTILAFAGLLISIPSTFASGSFHGTSSFENVPSEISRHFSSTFDLRLQYTVGPWTLEELVPVIEITPENAALHVHLDFEPVSLPKNSIARIPVTITVDPAIEYDKIFLSMSFEGTDSRETIFKSGWTDSLILSLGPRDEISRQVDYEKISWDDLEIRNDAAIFTKNMIPRSVIKAGEKFFVIQKVDFSDDNFAKNSTFDAIVGYAFEKGDKMIPFPKGQNATDDDHEKFGTDMRKLNNEFYHNAKFAKSFELKVNSEKPFLVKSSFALSESGLYTHQFYKKLKYSPAVSNSNMGSTIVVDKFSKALSENISCSNDGHRFLIKHDYSAVVCVSS
ncbi:MAG: hypothetical protein OEL52_00870 [Nitrosopumilus sp.]|nr:hypothetical protein [Nitrosopumilus sp.]MDH3394687.1 hypothetical protein [Nitrosopumilus sp.]